MGAAGRTLLSAAARCLFLSAALVCAAGGAKGASKDGPETADLIFTHAHVYTAGTWADALAVGGGRILAVGSTREVRKWRSGKTRFVNLKGQTVFPGLIDMNVHPLNGANLVLDSCNFAPGPAASIVKAVADCAALRKPGEWIIGGQFRAERLGVTATRQMLDAVAPNNPVLLVDASGHNIWANSRALRLAGISPATGLLRDAAIAPFLAVIPPPTPETLDHDLDWATQLLLSLGVTAFTDASVTRPQMKAYDGFADAGKLKQHVRTCMLWRPDFDQGKNADAIDAITEAASFARPDIAPTCVSISLDGMPGPAMRAAFIDPYEEVPGGPSNFHGSLLVSPDVLKAAVTRFDKAGLTVKFRASGDAAFREGLDAIEAARKANGPDGPRHEMSHANFVQASDIERAKALGATMEFSPAIWGAGGMRAVLGDDRTARAWPVREALDEDIPAVGGTDWPTASTPNIWYAIETLVTRLPAGATSGEPEAPGERITLEEAVDLYTIDAARQLGTDKDEGSIEAGKRADLIVLDKNPFDVPISEVHAVKVMATFIDGELVYGSPKRRKKHH